MRTFQAVIIFLLLNNLSNAQHYIKSFDNPNDGLFTIQFNKNINHGKVIIYDCISKPIAEFNLLNNSSFEIDITNEAKGIYLVQFITADFNATKRIVKH